MVNVLAWLLLGMVSGWAASHVFRAPDNGAFLHIAAGGMGAMIGGVVFLIFDTAPLSGFRPWGLGCALIGAAITIAIAQVVLRRPI